MHMTRYFRHITYLMKMEFYYSNAKFYNYISIRLWYVQVSFSTHLTVISCIEN